MNLCFMYIFIVFKILPGSKPNERFSAKKSSPTPGKSLSPVNREQLLTCLINEKALVMYSNLGNGSFGVVRKGDWSTPSGNKVRVISLCYTIK